MQKLNQRNLADKSSEWIDHKHNFSIERYDRDSVQPGIVHFGVGNFHRSHQAIYIDKLLGQGYLDWGIIGVSMRSAKIRDALKPQDFLFTEVTLGNKIEFRIIGSILNILVAPENPAAVINQIADGKIKLVTTTITEKGYYLYSGQLDGNHPDIVSDKSCLENPRSIYGYLAAAIIQRSTYKGPPLSVLCCDNIHDGGTKIKTGVHILLEKHSRVAHEWAMENVSFASSMVDRVSPATDGVLKQLVNSTLGLEDAWPVAGEPFTQWVIEDNLIGLRPALDQVGALFTVNISLYEKMKLGFLNAGHSIISVLGYLNSRAMVHQALEDPLILEFVQKALHENFLPVTEVPKNCRAEDYIVEVMQRFQNRALPYTVQQVNNDSSQKIQQRWFQNIDSALAKNIDTKLMSFVIAAWVLYVEKALDRGDLCDPQKDSFVEAYENDSEPVKQFLIIAGADGFFFSNHASFMNDVLYLYKKIKCSDIKSAIRQFLSEHLLEEEETSYP
ncbi:MAG: mannitol dehydrogenase family protein [Halieaceae bacterium]|nr:mannitol dehydrogenase family protein [Halieaceae bacterium]